MALLYSLIKTANLKTIFRIKNVIILLVVLVFCLFDVYPKLWQIGLLGRQISLWRENIGILTPEESLRRQQQLGRELSRVERQTQLLAQDLKDIKNKITAEKNLAVVTLALEDAAAAAKLEVTSIKPLERLAVDSYVIVPLAVGLRGDYGPMLSFLKAVENSAAPMSVQTLAVQPGGPAEAKLDIQLKLYLLFAREETQHE
jgi:Tfp pilus assembly protein PilO